MKEHIINILRDVAKNGASGGRLYLESRAQMIIDYLPDKSEVSLLPPEPESRISPSGNIVEMDSAGLGLRGFKKKR